MAELGFVVTGQSLRDTSKSITANRNSIENTLNNITNEMRNMKQRWESEAANEFISQFEKLKGYFQNYYQVIDSYSKFLNETAQAYDEADSAINKDSMDLFK